jgi:hypothetical protein
MSSGFKINRKFIKIILLYLPAFFIAKLIKYIKNYSNQATKLVTVIVRGYGALLPEDHSALAGFDCLPCRYTQFIVFMASTFPIFHLLQFVITITFPETSPEDLLKICACSPFYLGCKVPFKR